MNIVEKVFYLPKYLLGYSMGDPDRNGEYRFAKYFVRDGMIIFDIGSNIGEYTSFLLSLNRNILVHCFEPVNNSYMFLQNNPDVIRKRDRVFLNSFGLGDKEEERIINIYNDNAGSNSLFLDEYHLSRTKKLVKEIVRIITIDSYIKKNRLEKVDFIKIDTEGADLLVLKGMENSLMNKKVKAIQFEYGGYWKASGSKLVDAIRFLESFGFNLYRLTPWGKIRVKSSNNGIENFLHSNYVALLK